MSIERFIGGGAEEFIETPSKLILRFLPGPSAMPSAWHSGARVWMSLGLPE
jgi:hypothetical protein